MIVWIKYILRHICMYYSSDCCTTYYYMHTNVSARAGVSCVPQERVRVTRATVEMEHTAPTTICEARKKYGVQP